MTDLTDAQIRKLFNIRRLTKSEIDTLISTPLHTAVFDTEIDIFEPKTFEEYIGQREAKMFLQIIAEAARIENRSIPNLLISGSAGLGKTTLAKIILSGQPYTFVDGNSVNTTYNQLSGYAIIDEIHNVKPDVCDSLNVILDQGQLRILGATTNPGLLPSPFRSRFRSINLTPYTVNDLVRIMRNVLIRKKTLNINRRYLHEIAVRSRRTPRTALKIMAFVMDIMVVNGEKEASEETFYRALEMLGLDENGLLPIDRRYLQAFPSNGQRVGVQYLAAVTGIDQETIENEIEPWLMTLKKINRTSKGRELVRS